MTSERNRGRNPERGTWLRRRCRFLLLFIPSLLFSLMIISSFFSFCLSSPSGWCKKYISLQDSWRKVCTLFLYDYFLRRLRHWLQREEERREKKESLPSSSSWQKNKKKITQREQTEMHRRKRAVKRTTRILIIRCRYHHHWVSWWRR